MLIQCNFETRSTKVYLIKYITLYFSFMCQRHLYFFHAPLYEAQQSRSKLLLLTYQKRTSYTSLRVPITLTQTRSKVSKNSCRHRHHLHLRPAVITFAVLLCYRTSLTLREPDGKTRGLLSLSRPSSA